MSSAHETRPSFAQRLDKARVDPVPLTDEQFLEDAIVRYGKAKDQTLKVIGTLESEQQASLLSLLKRLVTDTRFLSQLQEEDHGDASEQENFRFEAARTLKTRIVENTADFSAILGSHTTAQGPHSARELTRAKAGSIATGVDRMLQAVKQIGQCDPVMRPEYTASWQKDVLARPNAGHGITL